MNKPTVLVDLDGIVANLHGPWIQWINKNFGLHLTGEDITNYWLPKLLPQLDNKVYGFLNKKGIYADLEPLPGAIEALTQLNERGYDVLIATSPARDPNTAADKLRWVKDWLPWLRRQDIFLCHRKELIKADAFIDDSPNNLVGYREAWGDGPLVITIDWPYNRTPEVEEAIDFRAGGYDDTMTAWVKIIEFLLEALPIRAEAAQGGG